MVLMLGLGCLKPPVPTAPEGTDAALVAYEVEVGADTMEDAPQDFRAVMSEALLQVGVTPKPVSVEGYDLLNAHTPGQQLEVLQEATGDAELLVVLRTEARYFSQLNGRFRWVVVVDATVVPPQAPEDALEQSFDVPVFLNFQHDDAHDALNAAAPVVDPRLRRMVTTVAAGL